MNYRHTIQNTAHKPLYGRFTMPLLIAVAFGIVVYGMAMQSRGSYQIKNSDVNTVAPTNEAAGLVVDIEKENPPPSPLEEQPPKYQYIEIIDSCGPRYEGSCVNMRSGPGLEYPVVAKLRTGIVLKVDEVVEGEGRVWYKIAPDTTIKYPERILDDWFVAGDFVSAFYDIGDQNLSGEEKRTTTKKIIVDRSEQMLYAYEGDELFMKEPISTGLELTPTPRGTFTVFKMTPSRYMQGPLPGVSDQYYDLPGVPWDLYFSSGGAVIHGAYWHDNFGDQWSHGCVNLPPEKAKQLYRWAELGMKVVVRD